MNYPVYENLLLTVGPPGGGGDKAGYLCRPHGGNDGLHRLCEAPVEDQVTGS